MSSCLLLNPGQEESDLSVHAWVVGDSSAGIPRAEDPLEAVVAIKRATLVEIADAASGGHDSSAQHRFRDSSEVQGEIVARVTVHDGNGQSLLETVSRVPHDDIATLGVKCCVGD